MKAFKFNISGNEYEVEIKNFEGNFAELEVNGTPYQVEVEKTEKKRTPISVRPAVAKNGAAKPAAAKRPSGGGAGAGAIKAPLPGTIMNIIAKEGDSVKKGDKILMYEAMKMENTLVSDREGVISSIKVGAGDNVLQGDVLVEIG